MRRKTDNTGGRSPICALATTRRAARLLTQLYDRHLSEYGIEAAQFALLMTLDNLPEKEPSSLAQALGMDKTTLSRNLKVLAVRGWVASARGTDARRRELSLTPEGRTVLAKAKSGWKAAQASLNQSLSGVAWDTMLTTIDGVSRAASAASE